MKSSTPSSMSPGIWVGTPQTSNSIEGEGRGEPYFTIFVAYVSWSKLKSYYIWTCSSFSLSSSVHCRLVVCLQPMQYTIIHLSYILVYVLERSIHHISTLDIYIHRDEDSRVSLLTRSHATLHQNSRSPPPGTNRWFDIPSCTDLLEAEAYKSDRRECNRTAPNKLPENVLVPPSKGY